MSSRELEKIVDMLETAADPATAVFDLAEEVAGELDRVDRGLESLKKDVIELIDEKIEVVSKMEGPRGEDGKTPIAGIDFEIPEDGERGSLFLGRFQKVTDLPMVDGIKVKPGDFAIVETLGEVWYA